MDQMDTQLLHQRPTYGSSQVPTQACWMVRKVLGAKDHLHLLHHAIDGKRSKIRQAYNQMLGDYPKVDWRGLICRNLARPKAIFILWLQIQNRLLTTDWLLKWIMQVALTQQTQAILRAISSIVVSVFSKTLLFLSFQMA